MLVPKSKWKLYSAEEIGPLEYAGRYDGGGLAFYYRKKTGAIDVRNRGVYNFFKYVAYVPHEKGSKKHIKYASLYRFHIDGKIFYGEDPGGATVLDSKYVDAIDGAAEEEPTSSVVKDFIYKIDTSSTLKLDSNIDALDFDCNSDFNVSIMTIDTRVPIIHITSEKQKDYYTFLVSIKDGEEFRYKCNIKTEKDLMSALRQTIDALNSYPKFYKYADDLEELVK